MGNRHTVGVLIGNANSPYTQDLMEGIISTAKKKDIDLLFYLGIHTDLAYRANFGNDDKDDYEYQFNVVYDYVEMSKVDALIISYGTIAHFMDGISKEQFLKHFEGIPYVMVEEEDISEIGSSVVVDNYLGMKAMVEHLVADHGYRDLIYLSGPKGVEDADLRLKAFTDVMTQYGCSTESDRIAFGDYTFHISNQVSKLLDAHPHAQALICANDLMADGAYQECEKRGLRIGLDIAITGYDDWKNAAYMTPPLSTVLQNASDMGSQALNAAFDLCNGKKARRYLVPSRLTIRASCGCFEYHHEGIPQVPEDMTYWMKDAGLFAEQHVHFSRELKKSQERYDNYIQETCFLPLISREMMEHVDNEQEFFRIAVDRISSFRLKKCYIYLFDAPVRNRKTDTWKCPDKLYLAAYQSDKKVISYKPEDRPVIDKEQGITDMIRQGDMFSVQVYVLFSGEIQYGILVTEITLEDMTFSYLASMQISNALKFLEISKEQRRTMAKLESLVQEINEKNTVLNFISGTDSMTGCLNRRGFIEAFMSLNSEYAGKEAALIFSDVDRLKEINDFFGHAAGDHAICHISKVLQDAVKGIGFVGRIGGDEFVSVIPGDEEALDAVLDNIRKAIDDYNALNEKDYYIETSVGFQRFVCSENLEFDRIMSQADEMLYQRKKNRRASVRREYKEE